MRCNVPDGHFHVFIFSERTFYAIYNGETLFQIRRLVAELHGFEHGGTTFDTFEKTFSLNVGDFYVKTVRWGLKIIFLTIKRGKVGYFHVTD